MLKGILAKAQECLLMLIIDFSLHNISALF